MVADNVTDVQSLLLLPGLPELDVTTIFCHCHSIKMKYFRSLLESNKTQSFLICQFDLSKTILELLLSLVWTVLGDWDCPLLYGGAALAEVEERSQHVHQAADPEHCLPLGRVGVVRQHKAHYERAEEAWNVGHRVGNPEHDACIVRGNVEHPCLTAGDCHRVEPRGQSKESDCELGVTAGVYRQHHTQPRQPEPQHGVDLPDGECPHQAPAPHHVCGPGAQQTDQPLDEVAEGGEEAVEGEAVPEDVGEVGGELLVESVVAPVGGGVAQHDPPDRDRGEDLCPGSDQLAPVQAGARPHSRHDVLPLGPGDVGVAGGAVRHQHQPEHRPHQAAAPRHVEDGRPAQRVRYVARQREDDQSADTGAGPEDPLEPADRVSVRGGQSEVALLSDLRGRRPGRPGARHGGERHGVEQSDDKAGSQGQVDVTPGTQREE